MACLTSRAAAVVLRLLVGFMRRHDETACRSEMEVDADGGHDARRLCVTCDA